LVVPCEIGFVRALRRDGFPKKGIAQRPDAEPGDAIEIVEARMMARFDALVAKYVADPSNRALDPTPEFQRIRVRREAFKCS